MLDGHLKAHTAPVADKENIVYFKDYRITVLSDRLFRIEKDKAGEYLDKATRVVWFRDMPKNRFSIYEDGNELQISTDIVTLSVNDEVSDCCVTFKDGKKEALDNSENLLGTYRTLDCCNGNLYTVWDRDTLMQTPIKLEKGVLAKNGVAVLDDTASVILDDDGLICERPETEADIYVFAFGHDYRAAIRELYMITGRVPLVPRFALGNWWSRYHDYSQKEYLHLMEDFEKDDIPFTVATVDMDWHWSYSLDRVKHITEDGKNDSFHGTANGWTGYSWNTELFPDYRDFLKKLHEMGLRVTLNLHPADGVRYFEDAYEEMAKAMDIDPKSEQQIRFDITDEKFINAYFKVLHKPYEHEGVDFWWIDWQQGNNSKVKGLDPLFALNHYHFADNAKEHLPLILSRYCGIGSHRYPLGFSGDTHVTWETLKFLPYFTATASNAGYSWWSHDIGGHMAGGKDNELNVRFVQFGVFSPINRLHCSNSLTFTKEPSAYKNGTGKIIESFLRLRHRMIPFLYSAAYETHLNGRALTEPMYYDHPEEEEAYRARDQYMFGGNLLVAPVITRSENYGMAETKVWLPRGRWTDIFTGNEYEGGKTISAVRYMDTIPVFAKEGAVFVLDARRHGNACDTPEKLEVMLFNGDGTYTLHEDKDGVRSDTCFELVKTGENRQKLTIRTTEEAAGAYKENRCFELFFKNIESRNVTLIRNGIKEEPCTDDNKCLSVTLSGLKAGEEIEMEVEYTIDHEERIKSAVLRELTFFECETSVKDRLTHEILNNRVSCLKDIFLNSGLPWIFIKRLLETADF
ncbi:MAG: alpha-xylosidase [Lachnospiraceae bacterium]|nr:alpha-xylosidase [Lachnospiraceae bacterium]